MSFTNLKTKLIDVFMILGLSMGSIAMAGDDYGGPDKDDEKTGAGAPQQTLNAGPDEGQDDKNDDSGSGY